MKTYKIIPVKQKLLMDIDKFSLKVEELINEKCNAGWELINISWVSSPSELGITALLTFRY